MSRLSEIISMVEAAGLSHSEVDDALRSALRATYLGSYVWIRDVYPDDGTVIYKVTHRAAPGEIESPTDESHFFSAAYVIADDGTATIGAATEVERVESYVPVGAASETLKKTEVRGDPFKIVEAKGQKRTIKVIQPGWGSSGFYPKDVIERDAPKTWPAGTHMYIAHPTAEEANQPNLGRTVEKLAAVLDTPAKFQENGPDGPGAYAKVTVAAPFVETIDSLADDIGTSVYATGDATIGEAAGRKGPIFERLWSAEEDPFTSIDFVPKAGAGGKVLAAIEGLVKKSCPPDQRPTADDDEAARIAEDTGTSKEAQDMGDETKLQEQLTAAESRVTTLQEQVTALTAENGTLRGRVALHEASAVVDKALADVELPDISKDRIREAAVKSAKLDEKGELDVAAVEAAVKETAAAEAEYVAKLTGSGHVSGQGAVQVEETKTKLEENFARLLGDSDKAKVAAAGRN